MTVALGRCECHQPAGGRPHATGGGRAELTGLVVPAGGAGVRFDAVTADVAADAGGVAVSELRTRVPKRDVAALLTAAAPAAVAFPDVPVKDNLAELFRNVRLTDVACKLDKPEVAFEAERVVLAASGEVTARLRAEGRTLMTEQKERFGVRYPEVRIEWADAVNAGVRLPVAVRGTADVRFAGGVNLLAAAVEVTPRCVAEIGKLTVDDVPGPVRGVAAAAGELAKRVKFGGRTPAEHAEAELNKTRRLPLFPTPPAADAAAVLERIAVTGLTTRAEADAIVLTATAAGRLP